MAHKPKGYFQEVLTGMFVVAVVLLLAYFTIVISGNNLFYPKTETEYTVLFDNVGALKLQDPVFVRGLKVGSVQKMTLQETGVCVTFRMDQAVALRDDYQITVNQTSLLGGTCLEVQPGVSETRLATTSLKGATPGNLVADLNSLVNELRDSFEPDDLRETISNARVVSQDLAAMTQRINRGEGLVGELLAPQSQLADDVRVSLANLRAATEKLNTTDNLIGKLLNAEDTLYDDLSATIKNARLVTDRLQEGKGALGALLSDETDLSKDFTACVANLRSFTEKLNHDNSMLGHLLSEDSALLEDLAVTAANLRSITTTMAEGKGTIGKLVYDDTIAVETEAVIKDVRQIIDNLRDTAPVTSFTSIFFGGF
jgi:phospholipid/cholesterol/gamma-HCH transport system substrate-binding protein